MTSFGKQVRAAREKRGYTQLSLAYRTELVPSTVSDIELDKNLPTFLVAVRLAKELHATFVIDCKGSPVVLSARGFQVSKARARLEGNAEPQPEQPEPVVPDGDPAPDGDSQSAPEPGDLGDSDERDEETWEEGWGQRG